MANGDDQENKPKVPKWERFFSCCLFFAFECLLPLLPFFLLICKEKKVSKEVLMITGIMSVAGMVNSLKNGGGLLFAFISFLGIFGCLFLQGADLPGTVSLATLGDFFHVALDFSNPVPAGSLWLIGIVVCFTVLIAIRFHGYGSSSRHWALPIFIELFKSKTQEEEEK